MRLSQAVLFSLVGIGLIPLMVASALLLTTSQNSLTTAIYERHLAHADSLSREVKLHLNTVAGDLQDYTEIAPVTEMGDNDRQRLVRLILAKRLNDFNMVTLWRGTSSTEPTAAARFRSPTGSLSRIAHEQEVQRLRAEAGDKTVQFSKMYKVVGDMPAVTILVSAGGNPPVFLAAEVNLARVQQTIEHNQIGTTTAYIVDDHGRLVAHPDASLVKDGVRRMPAELAEAGTRRVSGTRTFESDEGPLLGAWSPIHVGELGWMVVVAQPRADALLAVSKMTRQTAIIAVVALMLALGLAVYLSRSLSQPLQRVVSAALKIARGGFGARASVRARNEIGELAHTFNYMSTQLAEYDADRKRLYQELERGYFDTIRALANSIDAKDAYTRGHSQRVTDLAVETAKEMELTDHEIKVIQFGSILHDIGKIGIKDSVLRKATALTDEEYEYMKTHPMLGVSIIDPIDFLDEAKPMVRNHHERFDGRGYPDGLAGDDIPVGAMIVNIADAYDAMVTQRPYNTPMTFDQAVHRLKEIAGSQHDPKVTEAFLRVLFRRRAEEEVGGVWRAAQAEPPAAPTRKNPAKGSTSETNADNAEGPGTGAAKPDADSESEETKVPKIGLVKD